MIDFAALVTAPCVGIFARPIIVTPLASQPARYEGRTLVPAGEPYAARGVWASRPVDVATEKGIMSSQVHTLGILLLDFAVPPKAKDRIEIPAAGSLPRVGVCLVEDTDDDGQGGVALTVKIVEP